MKTHKIKGKNLVAEFWNDGKNGWAARLVDDEGNQIGDASYIGGRYAGAKKTAQEILELHEERQG